MLSGTCRLMALKSASPRIWGTAAHYGNSNGARGDLPKPMAAPSSSGKPQARSSPVAITINATAKVGTIYVT